MDVDPRRYAAIGKLNCPCSSYFAVRALGRIRFAPPQHREDFPCDTHSETRWLENQLKNNYRRFLSGGKMRIPLTKCSIVFFPVSEGLIAQSHSA
jgi:hypothetical protein